MDATFLVHNLLSPPILFFFVGMAATLLKSDLEIPAPIPRLFSIYLLWAIGFKGGVELSKGGLTVEVLLTLAAAVALSALVPIYTFFLLRRRLGADNAGAIAAAYGSVSAVTFITAANFLEQRGIVFGGHMVAATALMEAPAIVIGVLLARRYARQETAAEPLDRHASLGHLVREAFLNGPVFLLLGSLLVGLLSGERGFVMLRPFTRDIFHGVLVLFLLDMGLVAAAKLGDLRRAGLFPLVFALIVPLINAGAAIAVAWVIGIGRGDALLLAVLCASASYIAVPAAVRLAIPRASASLYLPMAIAITFPFNIAVGMPLYLAVIDAVWNATGRS